MSQDTRKDKRAKVVSLNVRYKSATVDEFIENHSHDVSKGGIFVKTPTPFPPGTLLKFEIRLAGDKSVISGVGRVVWKREPTQAGTERPAGMGVKFIKIDDASRAIIDQLIAHNPDAGSAYTSEPAAQEGEGHPSTLRGLVAAKPAEPDAAPKHVPVSVPPPPGGSGGKLPVPPAASPPPAAAAAVPPPPVANKPATMGGPPPARTASAAAAPAAKPGVAGAVPPKPTPPPPRAAGGPPPPVAHKPATAIGVAPAPAPINPAAAPAPKPEPSSPAITADKASEPKATGAAPRPGLPNRKATMMGIGIPSASNPPPAGTSPPPEVSPKAPKAEPAATPMFPAMDAASEEPVKEPTVMKQAAELLEEALKEAGGSMEEVGQNPLFAKTGGEIAVSQPAPAMDPDVDPKNQSGDTVIMASHTPAPPVASHVPEPTPPPSPSFTPSPSLEPSPPASMKSASSSVSSQLDPEPKKKGSGGIIALLLLILVGAGGGVFAWKSGLIGGEQPKPTSSPPATTTTPPTATTSAPTASAHPSASASETPTTLATDAGSDAGGKDAGGDAAPADAGKAATTTAVPPQPPPVKPPPVKPPPVKPPPTEPTTTPTAEPTAAPTPAPTPTTTAPKLEPLD